MTRRRESEHCLEFCPASNPIARCGSAGAAVFQRAVASVRTGRCRCAAAGLQVRDSATRGRAGYGDEGEAMTMTTTMKTFWHRGAGTALVLAAAPGAWAAEVADLPGGPAKNQINLHPPVTRIAS